LRRKKRIGCFGTVLIILLIVVVIAAFILVDSNTRLVTTEYVLRFDNLPDVFDGYRIVLLADLHGAQYGDDNEKLARRVIDASPDIIAIAGDLIDRYQPGHSVEDQIIVVRRLVEELVKIAPVYYVTGNHEWDSGKVRELLAVLEESGVIVLRNGTESLFYQQITGNDRLVLAGLDDPGGPADMVKPDAFIEDVIEYIKPEFLIVMVHRNYNLEMLSKHGVDLVLSGHAHGGMVRLPFTDGLIGPSHEFLPTYTRGVYTAGNTNMVVTGGLGNHLGWTRFLNNPQVVVVELRVK